VDKDLTNPRPPRGRRSSQRLKRALQITGGITTTIFVLVCLVALFSTLEAPLRRQIEEGKRPRVEWTMKREGGVLEQLRNWLSDAREAIVGKTQVSPGRVSAPVWNVWAEQLALSPSFSPVSQLYVDAQYLLVVDLSALAYTHGGAVQSFPSSIGLQKQLTDWLQEEPRSKKGLLEVLALPDPGYFDSPAERAQPLEVDLDKMRKSSIDVQEDPLEVLRHNSDPDFLFGNHVHFSIKTKFREGPASIAFSIWANGRPVDEFWVPFCVTAPGAGAEVCKNSPPVRYSLKGIDSLRLSSEKGPFPDAALHFLELDRNTLTGVFRRNDWKDGQYETWTIRHSAGWLYEQFRNTVIPAFNRAASDQSLRERGADLYNLLFPSQEAKEARARFEEFVLPHLQQDSEGGTPPSIFIRMIPGSQDPFLLIPLGLMAVRSERQKFEFLGFHFRVETPLEFQKYHSGDACISRWVVAVPPDKDAVPPELRSARKRFSKWIPLLVGNRKDLYEDMNKFGAWIRQEGPESTASTIMILGHHDQNVLSFSQDELITSQTVEREFQKPSVAILNACGTGRPGAAEFVRELNSRGIETVIATGTEISPSMAGDYIDCLAQVLKGDKSGTALNLSMAHFRAIQRLRKRRAGIPGEPTYGPQVLTYSLLGNGNLRVCLPASEVQ